MKIDTSKPWDPRFAPSFTPMEMVKRGVFMDCHYNAVIKGLPSAWYEQKNIIKLTEDPDATKNYYGVKSRQSLKVWQQNEWTTKDSPLGWWEWYVKYYFGRRLDEDRWQIGRWRSFVARHMGQVNASCKLSDEDCHRTQRQGLLQWAWDSSKKFEEEVLKENLDRLGVSKFEDSVPKSMKW
jgi:hypothetical protein